MHQHHTIDVSRLDDEIELARPLTRRRFALLTAAAAGAIIAPFAFATSGRAQDATPTAAARLADLGYPELRLVATDAAPEVPREVAAGRYLVVLENRGTPGGPSSFSDVNFIQIPPGAAIDELNALLEVEGAQPPDWVNDLVSSGGFYVAAGQTGYGVLDLEPGEWYVGVGDTNPFTPLTVTEPTAATPGPSGDPAADITVEFREFALDLPEQFPAGRLVWHVSNPGEQTHYITFARTPELLTVEQVQALIGLPEGGTPPPGVPEMSTVEVLVPEVKNLSPGRQIWLEMDLSPGFYGAFCAVTDPASGMPHALLGEVAVFTVG